MVLISEAAGSALIAISFELLALPQINFLIANGSKLIAQSSQLKSDIHPNLIRLRIRINAVINARL